MQTISFLPEFLDALLRGDKQQTTRRQTDRIKVGDVCYIYIDPRTPLTYAHILGKVQITEVYVMRHPIGIFPTGLEEWALKDGFDTYLQADDWFTKRYGNLWLYQNWTVIKWNGWTERYFKPD